MAHTILGVFDSQATADQAWSALREVGYDSGSVSVMAREGVVIEADDGSRVDNAASGAVSGAVTGGAIAGIAGLLVGLGVIAIPGIGGLLIGGPLVAALGLTGTAATTASAAATGAVAGGLVGALAGLGVPQEEASILAERIKTGAIVLAVDVHTMEETADIEDLFRDAGASDVTKIRTKVTV